MTARALGDGHDEKMRRPISPIRVESGPECRSRDRFRLVVWALLVRPSLPNYCVPVGKRTGISSHDPGRPQVSAPGVPEDPRRRFLSDGRSGT